MNNKRNVVVDYRIKKSSAEELKNLGFNVIPTVCISSLYDEICGHADIQLHSVNNKIICAPEAYEYYKKLLPDSEIICGSKILGRNYPADIPYNTCRIGEYAVCNIKYTAQEILNEYGDKILNTRQGYAKCNICVVSDNAAITSDKGIYSLLKNNNIDVLKIEKGYITLNRMDGFIGGASGLLSHDLLVFNGDLHSHPNCGRIVSFCRNHRVMVTSLGKGYLEDVGSILPI